MLVVALIAGYLYTESINKEGNTKMANITITLTEEELHALEVAKNMMDNMFTDNMAIDAEFEDDHYARAHRGLDSLEAKIDAKIGFEQNVAHLKETYPHHSMAYIRKALRDHNKKEG